MLKIKDDVDLKELEKFGLKRRDNYNEDTYKIIILEGEDFAGWVEIDGFQIWKNDFWSDCFELETLYDLITAGLVEKVEE